MVMDGYVPVASVLDLFVLGGLLAYLDLLTLLPFPSYEKRLPKTLGRLTLRLE